MSVNSILFMTSVSSLISLLSFCLVDQFIGKGGVLKSHAISVWGLMCNLSFNVSFTYVGALILGT